MQRMTYFTILFSKENRGTSFKRTQQNEIVIPREGTPLFAYGAKIKCWVILQEARQPLGRYLI